MQRFDYQAGQIYTSPSEKTVVMILKTVGADELIIGGLSPMVPGGLILSVTTREGLHKQMLKKPAKPWLGYFHAYRGVDWDTVKNFALTVTGLPWQQYGTDERESGMIWAALEEITGAEIQEIETAGTQARPGMFALNNRQINNFEPGSIEDAVSGATAETKKYLRALLAEKNLVLSDTEMQSRISYCHYVEFDNYRESWLDTNTAQERFLMGEFTYLIYENGGFVVRQDLVSQRPTNAEMTLKQELIKQSGYPGAG